MSTICELNLNPPAVVGKFVSRSNRFVVSVFVEGERARAFLSHTGRLTGLLRRDRDLLVRRPSGKGPRTLPWDVLAARAGRGWALVDPRLGNRLVEHALRTHAIRSLADYTYVRPEVKIGAHRLDFEVGNGVRSIIEVKSCPVRWRQAAIFPDAPSVRSARQVEVLERLERQGTRAVLIFLAARSDVSTVRINHDVDPDFCAAVFGARRSGVTVMGFRVKVSLTTVGLGEKIPVMSCREH